MEIFLAGTYFPGSAVTDAASRCGDVGLLLVGIFLFALGYVLGVEHCSSSQPEPAAQPERSR